MALINPNGGGFSYPTPPPTAAPTSRPYTPNPIGVPMPLAPTTNPISGATSLYHPTSIYSPPAPPTTPAVPTTPAMPGGTAIPRTPATPPITPPTTTAGPTLADIQKWYQQYLGRPGGPSEWSGWVGNPGAETAISGSQEARTWRAGQAAPTTTTSGGTGTGTTTTGTGGVFDDPATRAFEALLNQRISELNGPAYTNGQMDLMQTQATDPIEHQRTAAKQQLIERMAAHGIGPSSGLTERAIEDIDRQFNQLRTTTQAGFASKAVDQTAQNRNLAVQMGEILPNMAWQRVTGSPVPNMNSPQLLALQNLFSQQGTMNSQAWMNSVMQILGQLFPH